MDGTMVTVLSSSVLSLIFALLLLPIGLAGSPLALSDSLPVTAAPTALVLHPLVVKRQDEPSTITYTPSTTVSESFDSTETSTDNGPTRTIPALHPANTPIPLAATMGLIMPNPWGGPLYAGVNYSFGFVDAVARPAPTTGGWLRHVQPLLVFPDYTVNVFPASGHEQPGEDGSVPYGSQGLCGATVEDYAIAYPYNFNVSGRYMYVVNQTWVQPTIDSNDTCQLPLVSQKSFFASQILSIAPRPTVSPYPPDPTAAYTVFASVSTTTPTRIPQDLTPSSASQKLAVGFGVVGAVLAIACIGGIMWWVRKKHKMERDVLAFSRMSEADRVAFLAENPQHFLNPNRLTARNAPRPPVPPGTLAYAQWYWQQMRERQQASMWQNAQRPIYNDNGGQYGWQGANNYNPVGMGQGYQSQVPYMPVQRPSEEPVMVYKTY